MFLAKVAARPEGVCFILAFSSTISTSQEDNIPPEFCGRDVVFLGVLKPLRDVIANPRSPAGEAI